MAAQDRAQKEKAKLEKLQAQATLARIAAGGVGGKDEEKFYG